MQVKVLGLVLVVASIVGAVTLLVVRDLVTDVSRHALEEGTEALAESLASQLERPLLLGDGLRVHDILAGVGREHQHLAWALLVKRDGSVTGRRAEGARPALASRDQDPGAVQKSRRWHRDAGTGHRVFVVAAPVLGGQLGRVEVAVDGHPITQRAASAGKVVLAALTAATFLGLLLAVWLTRVIVRPIHALVDVANAASAGDLDKRAQPIHGDEVGQLALRFNEMLASLQSQRDALLRERAERKRLVDKVISSEEDERARIARELHDELGQTLTALRMSMTGAKAYGHHCIRHRAEVDEAIGEAIDQVRRMAWRLRPSILDDYGLESALRRHVEEIAAISPCTFDIELVSEPGLPERIASSVEVALYRIAQEAVTNVVRHANARHASLTLFRTRRLVRLLVEDDGAGFVVDDAAPGANGRGLGLAGMVERASMVGGELAIESAPGQGTAVRVTVPLES